MPTGVERALADSLSLEHPDVPWQLPEVPPPTSDLRAALQILEAQAAPATRKHVAWCLAKLALAFEPHTKLSPEDTNLRATVWLEACGDLGDELWSKATMAAITGSKWMPKPSEFRGFVEQQMAVRAKRLQRCKAMLDGTRAKAAQPSEQPLPTRMGRLLHIRSTYERLGRPVDVERLDRLIAEESGETPKPTANYAEDYSKPAPAGPYQPADTPTNRRLAELAAAKREGRAPAEHRDVAETR